MKKRYQVLLGLGILSMITYLDRAAIAVTGIQITKDLNLTEKQFGYVLGAFSLAYGLFEIPTGFMGDKWGAKSTLIRIVIWWSIFTFLTGFSSSLVMLVCVRFLFGMGEAGAYPNMAVAVSRWFPTKERGGAQSIIWSLSRLGGALSPIIVAFLMSFLSWHYVFYCFGIIGIIWSIYWRFWFKDEPRDMKNISAEELDYIEKNRSIKQGHVKLHLKKMLSNKNLWFLYGGYFSLASTAYFYMSWLPKYLKNARGATQDQLAFFASLPFLMGIVGCLIGGFMSDYLTKKKGIKFGRSIVGFTGLILAGTCIIIATYTPSLNTTVLFLSMGLAFKDFALPVAFTAATDIGGKNSGAISGTMNMFSQLGSTITSILFGYMITWFGNWDYGLMMFGFLAIFGGLCWVKLDASKQFNPEA